MKSEDKDNEEPGPVFRFCAGAAAVLTLVGGPVAVAATPGGHNTPTVISASATVTPADTHELPGGGGTRIPGSSGYSGRGTATTVTWLTGLPRPPHDNGGAARTI